MTTAGRGSYLVLSILFVGWAVCAASFVHGPYCGAPSADSMTVCWEADAPAVARVEYGIRGDFEATGLLPEVRLVPAPEDNGTVEVTLDGLQADTDYAYRVVLGCDGDLLSSDPGFFSTAPTSGTSVSFAVLADTQWQSEGTNRLEMVGDAIADDPTPFDFILHAGDVVESPSTPYWDHWFASFDRMLLRAPFIPVLGNHERNDRSYYETFALPPGEGLHDERWWALHWGDVVVVGLDTNVRKPAEYYAQQDWARDHLAGPEPHKFVIFHHPVFSSDALHGSGYGYDVIYHPIFVEHGVDIVFNGHSHHYEHIVRDGVTYMVVGGGGATPRATTPEHIQGSDVSVEGHYFYVRVNTMSAGIDVECVSVAREAEGDVELTPALILDAFPLGIASKREETAARDWGPILTLGLIATIALWTILRSVLR